VKKSRKRVEEEQDSGDISTHHCGEQQERKATREIEPGTQQHWRLLLMVAKQWKQSAELISSG
jgi:hypothetical protein